MPFATIDGIRTRYEVWGSGPPVLCFAPGGFGATIDNWHSMEPYRRTRLLEHLQRTHTCVVFDRREAGESGGRVEAITWGDYAAQGRGLLDHLGFEQAYLLGACVGCSIALTLALEAPERVLGLVLYSPAGGPRYRIAQQQRLAQHLAHVDDAGLDGVAQRCRAHDDGFSKDPSVGPWVEVIRRDPAFAASYATQDVAAYRHLVETMGRGLFSRDTVPGPAPEDLLRLQVPALIVPGDDPSHATSAARYLQECLDGAEYWDVGAAEQTEQTAPARVESFLAR